MSLLTLRTGSKNVEALERKGYALVRLRNYSEALKCFDTALEIDPKNASAIYGKGTYFLALRRYKEALKCFDTALEIDPKSTSYKDAKALVLSILGKPEKAMVIMKEVLDSSHGNPNPHYLDTEGFILYKLGKHEEALDKFDEALEKDPGNSEAWYNKGEVKFAQKDYDAAIRCYDEALEKDPNFAQAHNAKAVALSKNGEHKKAIEEVKKAIELDPALAEAHENLTKLVLSTSGEIHEFWQFWRTSKKRLIIPIVLGALAAGLVLYSLYTGSEVRTTNEATQDGNTSTTINTSRELKIPETYLIVLGLIVVILLAPEIRTAKQGPVELDLSKEPLVSTLNHLL